MENRIPRTDPSLARLAPSDQVKIRDGRGVRWAGTVDVVAADLGVIWIYTAIGERQALDVFDYEITGG